MKHVLTDNHLAHFDQVPANRDERLAELVMLLDITFEGYWHYLGDLLSELLKESFAAEVERLQLLLSVLEFAHQLGLVSWEVADSVVQTDQHVDYS